MIGLAITTSQSSIADPVAVAPAGSFFFLPPFRSTAIEDSQSSTPTSFLPVYENIAFSATSASSFTPSFSFPQQTSLDLNEASTLLDNSFSFQSAGKSKIFSLFRETNFLSRYEIPLYWYHYWFLSRGKIKLKSYLLMSNILLMLTLLVVLLLFRFSSWMYWLN